MKVRRFGMTAFALVLVVGAAAACSSSSKSANGGGGAEVVVGAIGDYSGAYGSGQGGIPKVLAAWESSVNASGGLNGQKVKVIAKDAGTATGANATAARELIGRDHAVAIIDTDFGDSAWLSYASTQHVPVVLGYPSTSGMTDANAFPVMGSTVAIAYALMQTAKTFGNSVGVVYCAESCGQQSALFPKLAKAVGLSVPVFLSASSTAPDYTAVCRALADKKVGSYQLNFAIATATRIVDTCYQAGVRIPTVLGGYSTSVAWKTDKAFEGSLAVDGVAPFFASNTPGQKAYRTALSKYASSIPGTTVDDSWSSFAWASGQLVAAGAKNSTGKLTAAALADGMYALKNETLGGLVQPLNFAKGKPTNLTCYYTWKIGSGSFVPGASGDKPLCVSPAELAPVFAALGNVPH